MIKDLSWTLCFQKLAEDTTYFQSKSFFRKKSIFHWSILLLLLLVLHIIVPELLIWWCSCIIGLMGRNISTVTKLLCDEITVWQNSAIAYGTILVTGTVCGTKTWSDFIYRQPGQLWTFLKHLSMSLLPGLSNTSAYRLNVTLITLVPGTAITQKILHPDKPYILSQKGFKVTPLFGVTLNPQPTCI